MNNYSKKELESRYIQLLSARFPTITSASSEIINLEAICSLPKGTEHFLSDLHGENEAFAHILKNGSGVIRKKIDEALQDTIDPEEKKQLATLIYYPVEVLELKNEEPSFDRDWYYKTLLNLVLVCRAVLSKYSRSKVRKGLPQGFVYILEELLHEQEKEENKQAYYDKIITTIIDIGRADRFIIAICKTIQRFSIDRLHIIGDIFDRGDGPHLIMDILLDYHSVDFQWGNHDMLWMGAYTGNECSIASAVRISMRYGNDDLLDEAYGINMLPLAKFSSATYEEVEENFYILSNTKGKDKKLLAQMHKAISVILFKLEGQFIKRNPSYGMNGRLVLDFINYDDNTITINNKTYKLNTLGFPTIDRNNPYELTPGEREVMDKLRYSFTNNEKLRSHIDLLFEKGSMYLIYNNNLLFHGCIPTDDDGAFTAVKVAGKYYSGRALLDKFEKQVRKAYYNRFGIIDQADLDVFYYLWCGPNSSLFGKNAMTTFERYFIEDKEAHKEGKNAYYKYNEDPNYCDRIFEDFDMDKSNAKIVNGHVPVKVGKGESPIKAGGKLIIIDGGLSKAYQKVTDIAGYTLIYNSHGMLLAQHEPFVSAKEAIRNNIDLISEVKIVYNPGKRITVEETDKGKKLRQDINDLKVLLSHYYSGMLDVKE